MLNSFKPSVFAVLFFLMLLPGERLCAQTPVPSERLKETVTEQERSRQLEEITEKQKEEKEAETESLGKEVTDKNDEKIVQLKEIKFSKSDLLPASFFEEIKKKFEGTQVSVNEIYAIVAAINNEYMIKGYIASQAFLQEQDITDGALFVSLVEGVISEVKVTGNKTTSEKYIKRYIDLETIDSFNANITDQDIMNFNAANDVTARIALSPGKVFGTSEVDIVINEPNRYSLSLFVDNSGQEETGFTRYGGYATIRSLTKYRDIINLGGVFSDGSNAAYVSYEIPEPFFNARVGAGFDYSDTEIVNGGLRTLDVTGNFYNVYIYVKKPFLVRERTSTNLTFNINTKHGASYVSDYKTQDTKTDAMSLSADNTFLFKGGYIFNMFSYAQGMKLINGDTIFEKLSYYGEGFIGFLKDFGAKVKLRGQWAFDTVPSSEQFSIGGINTVRGYREGMLMARDGAVANAEVQYDLNFLKVKYLDFTRVYAFFDIGSVFYESGSNLPDDYDSLIYSTGVGLKIGIFRHLDAHLICAVPLKEHKYYQNDNTSLLFVIQGRI